MNAVLRDCITIMKCHEIYSLNDNANVWCDKNTLIILKRKSDVMFAIACILWYFYSFFTLLSFQHLAESLQTAAGSRGLKTSLVDLRDYDPEDNLTEEVRPQFSYWF